MSTSEESNVAARQRQWSTNATLYFRIIIGVVLVIAAIVVYNRYYGAANPNFTLPQEESATAVAGQPLFSGLDEFEPQTVTVVSNGVTMTLSKSSDGSWQVVSPLRDTASAASVDELIESLTRLRYAGIDESVSNLSDYGLDKPWLTATMSDGSSSYSVRVGDKELDGSYDVLKSGDPATVYHVGNISPFVLDLRPFELVQDNMLAFDNANVVGITVKQPGQEPLTFTRDERGDWLSTLNRESRPFVVFNVDAFLEGLRYVSATDIVPDQANADYGFYPAPNSMQVELDLKGGKTATLNIGKLAPDGRHYYTAATGRPHTYQVVEFVPDNLRARLGSITTNILDFKPDNLEQIEVEPTPQDYRELTSAENFIADMTALQYIQVQQSIGIQLETDTVTYANENGVWKSNGSVAFGLGNLIEDLSNLQVYSSAPDADDKTLGFTEAQGSHTVTLTFKDNTQRTFTIGTDAAESAQPGIYVFASSQAGQWVAPADLVKEINFAVTHVRQTLMDFKPADVTEIRILQGDSTATLKLSGSDWVLGGQATKSADDVNKLLTTLSTLGAESLVDSSEVAEAGFYPGGNGTRVELVLKDGSVQTLDIGNKKQIGTGWFASYDYYVKSGDFKDIGLIPDSSLEDTLDEINSLSH